MKYLIIICIFLIIFNLIISNNYHNINNIANTKYLNEIRTLYPECILDEYHNDNLDLKDTLGNKIYPIYGEMNCEGLNQLFNQLKKYNKNINSFIDIGCGRGKLVLTMAGYKQIKKSYGIEIVEDRINHAIEIKNKLSHFNEINKVDFINKSMFDIDYTTLFDTNDNTLIWMSNLCFGDEMSEKIINKLANEMKKNTILICSNPTEHERFKLIKKIVIPMSWDDESEVFIYVNY